MGKLKRIQDIYRFPSFRPTGEIRGIFGDPLAVIITLQRRQKKLVAGPVDTLAAPSTIVATGVSEMSRVAISGSSSNSPSVEWLVPSVML